MSWNRKYRPQQIQDLHLGTVRQYFLDLMKRGSFPQVFLFAGPKGTGKTSTARIIGALLNDPSNAAQVDSVYVAKKTSPQAFNEPDVTAPQFFPIISGQSFFVQELDAASNRGIDDVRALKERVQLPPVEGKVAVYILDEVHMLTTEAFNALLKLLEEPPAHVVFILATTELQKVPETVASRCQVIHFTQASVTEIADALHKVAKAESLQIQEDALAFISTRANGSFRDGIKMLEQVAQSGKLELAEVEQLLGAHYQQEISQLLTALLDKDSQQIVEIFEGLRTKGLSETGLHKDMVQLLHTQLLIGLGLKSGSPLMQTEVARFLLSEFSLCELSQATLLPFLRLELKFLELVERSNKKSKPVPPSSTPPTSNSTGHQSKASTKPKPESAKVASTDLSAPILEDELQVETVTELDMTTQQSRDTTLDTLSGDGQLLLQQWPDFVKQVAQSNFSLATLLKSARPVSGDTGLLTLNVFYRFHQEQLQQPKFNQLLNNLIAHTYGGPVKINCILADNPPEAELAEPTMSDQLEKLAVDVLM